MKQTRAQLKSTPRTSMAKGRATWDQPSFPDAVNAANRNKLHEALPIVASLVLAAFCGLSHAAEPTGDDPVFALRGEEARGYSSGGMNLSEYEQVNLANGNLTLAVPLASVTTDGGLSYSVSAHYNSKIGGVGDTFGYYRGVESYGLGWDLRPPRVSAWFECDELGLSYPEECPLGSADHAIKYTILSLTSQSGAEQQVIAVPPAAWKDAGNLGYDIDDDSYSGEVCPRTTVPTQYEDPFGDCRCIAQTGKLSICYTWDEPLVRITIDAQTTPVTVVVEDESGTVSRYGQIVDVRSRVSRQAPWAQLSPEEIEVVNFREEVDGFYLKSLERGPWQDDVAANVITFDYDDDTPWLVESIRANGVVERRVDFDYNPHLIGELDPPPMMLDTITAPAFSGGQRVISFEYNDDLPVNAWPDEPPSPHLPPDWTWDAPFLSSIVSDAGAGGGDLEWAFSTGIPPNPLNEVHIRVFTLPTGGTIEYEYTGFPQVLLCQFPEEDPLETQGVWFGSAALFRRTIRIPDATLSDSDPVMRVETTAMARNINCPGIPNPYQLEFPDCMPYPDSPFFQGIPQLLGQAAYRWVWVETYAGDAEPWDMTTTSTGEIHRFFFHNFREFSADYFSTIPTSARGVVAEFYPNRQLGRWRPKDESFLLGWNDVQVLRHQQTRRATLFGDDYSNPVNYTEIPCCPMPWEHVFNTVERATTITDEAGGDVRSCALLVPNDPEAVECQAVTTEFDISDFFRTESETSIVTGSPIPDHESRFTVFGYADPKILENPLVWDLGKRDFAASCYWPLCTTEAVRSRWELEQGYVRLKTQWTNPQPTGEDQWHCDADVADCTQTDYAYDDHGNVIRVSRSGGYAGGFGQPAPDEVTEYLHGRPVRRWIEDGSSDLLLWETGIDPGTGLTRWVVDGSGAGKAFLYDSLGRITDSAPIEGDQGAGGEWILTLQPYEYDPSGNPLFIKGSHFTYLNPTAETLAMREAWDASYNLSPSGELSLAAPPELELRARLHLDGMGRPTQLTERRPDGSGSRTRYSLGYFHDSSAGSVLNPCDLGATTLTTPARVDLLSEWVDGDGDSWPGCAALSWSSTHYDGLNRPALQALPDGSSISTGYRGSDTTTTTRTVATSTTQDESEMETVTVTDAFGRLRRLLEQRVAGSGGCLSNPSLCIESLYEYDVKDRLRDVAVGANSTPQNRSFEYSGAGFLMSSTEPERYTKYRGYDALGNLREEVTKLDPTFADPDPVGYEFDGFSRLVRKFTGPPTFELDLATFAYGTSGVGSPAYNKVEKASQHNRYGSGGEAPAVLVSQTWQYGGPGGRVSSRTTRIGDPVAGGVFGAPGDGFVLEYLYDVWGNVSSVKHPRWSPWDLLCPTATEVESLYAYDGSWLTGAGLFREDDQTAYAGAGLAYQPSGRPQITAMYADGLEVATQVEVGDASGMPRPGSITFSADGEPKWSQTGYAYDGSGNVRSFGIWSAGGASSSRQHTYDGLNRLTALYDGAALERSYAYDPYGNITALGSTTIVPDPATNRISSINNIPIPPHPGYGFWDVRGNLRKIPDFSSPQREKELLFSTEDRLMQSVDVDLSAMWRYAYDTAGERVVSWATDGIGHAEEARITIRDEGGMPLTDWLWTGGAEPAFSRSRDYLYAGGRMVAQVDWGAGTPTRRFAAVDHLGSTRYLVGIDDALGIISEEALEFYPFGGFKVGDYETNTTHLFTGHERDLGLSLSELDYMHARYYSPNLGRFVSVDPVGGTVGSSQSWNRYSYVENNPVLMVDPDGRAGHPGTWIGAAIGFGAGLITASVQETRAILGGQQRSYSEINRNLAAGAMGGAVTGAIAGSCGGCNLGGAAVVGSGAAMAGGGVRRAIDAPSAGTDVLDPKAIATDAVAGGVGGAGGAVVAKTAKAALAPAISNQQMGAAAARASASAEGAGITGQSMAEAPARAAISQMENAATATGAVAGEIISSQSNTVVVEIQDDIQSN